MTRIVAGSVGGRRIDVPPRGTRPTSGRVREALFSALEASGALAGAAVLDLCAGSGALGLEALSRGAAHVLFVESDRRVAAVLRRNVATLGFAPSPSGAEPPRAEVRVAPVASVLCAAAPRRYDVLLADPPYALPGVELTGWLASALAHGWLADTATVVLERPVRGGAIDWPVGLQEGRERRYGDTVLHLGYRRPV